MHTKPVLQDLKAEATSEHCIKINIDNDLSLDEVNLKVLGPERTLLLSMKPRYHEFELCLYTGKPMFVELHTPSGNSVQYVKGSGNDFYSDN
jgi:hypothetical protein